LTDIVRRARDGSVQDARGLISLTATILHGQRGKSAVLPAELAEYLADAFDRAAHGVKIDRAFKVVGKVGPNAFGNEARNAWIAHYAAFARMLSPKTYLRDTADFCAYVGLGYFTRQGIRDAIRAHDARQDK
jgi:hypothetical protein